MLEARKWILSSNFSFFSLTKRLPFSHLVTKGIFSIKKSLEYKLLGIKSNHPRHGSRNFGECTINQIDFWHWKLDKSCFSSISLCTYLASSGSSDFEALQKSCSLVGNSDILVRTHVVSKLSCYIPIVVLCVIMKLKHTITSSYLLLIC